MPPFLGRVPPSLPNDKGVSFVTPPPQKIDSPLSLPSLPHPNPTANMEPLDMLIKIVKNNKDKLTDAFEAYAEFRTECEETDCETDCEEVYMVKCGVDEYCGNHQHLKKFKTYSTEEGDYKTTYYQTYGGGPEGGYFLRTFQHLNGFDPLLELYRVERAWGDSFAVEEINAGLDYNPAKRTLRIVP